MMIEIQDLEGVQKKNVILRRTNIKKKIFTIQKKSYFQSEFGLIFLASHCTMKGYKEAPGNVCPFRR